MEGDELDLDWEFVRRPNEMDVWSSSAEHKTASAPPLQVLFTTPSKYWTDAAPIGNGRLGAMVWGGVHSEKLQLNDDTLWTGIPGNYTNPQVPIILPEVRELVDSGQYAKATAASYNLLGNPSEADENYVAQQFLVGRKWHECNIYCRKSEIFQS